VRCPALLATLLLTSPSAQGAVVDLIFSDGFQPPSVCGNDLREAGEVCDDGNLGNGDNCNPTCRLTNTVTLFAGQPQMGGFVDGGPGIARLGSSGDILVVGSSLYTVDVTHHILRKIDIATRVVQTIAGTAPLPGSADNATGLLASFSAPNTLASDGSRIWVGDEGNGLIREVSLTPPYAVTKVAGPGPGTYVDGIGAAAGMPSIRGMTYHEGFVYFTDSVASTVRRFDPVSREVLTIAGIPNTPGHTNGPGSSATFIAPRATVVAGGFLYIGDTNGAEIRAYDLGSTMVSTFAGDGTQPPGYLDGIGTAARVHRPRGLTTDGESLYWAEFNAHTMRQAVIATASVTTLAGTPAACAILGTCSPPAPGGYAEGVGSAAAFDDPFSVSYDPASRSLFVLDSGNFVIRRIQ
jgi:cysteine-rich repeat protein